MALRPLTTKYQSNCCECNLPVMAGTAAWYNPETRYITCDSCHQKHNAGKTVDMGVAGRSAHQESLRRQQQTQAVRKQRWGALAPVASALAGPDTDARRWDQGAGGEALTAKALARRSGPRLVVLNDRAAFGTNGNIDHIVICASGIWVVDSKAHRGRIKLANAAKAFTEPDWRLVVAGVDQSKLADGMQWQIRRVKEALGDDSIAVRAALCFTAADFGWRKRPLRVRGVWCMWPGCLVRSARRAGDLDAAAIGNIARRLNAAFPPA